MALGDVLIKGKLKIEGTTEMAGFAKDATLITSLNADQVDSADKDTDGTLAADSDAKIPSQKAVKAYVDTNGPVVRTTGNQTIGGVKTFSSIPLFPANTIETTDIQDLAVTGAKIASSAITQGHINKTFDTIGHEDIPLSSYWTPIAGLYMWAGGSVNTWLLEIYEDGAWRISGNVNGGFLFTDGSNIRVKNNGGSTYRLYFMRVF